VSKPCAIGLDIGLSTTKAVAIAPDGRVIASASRESVNLLPRPRWVERDPDVFRRVIFETLADLSTRLEGYDVVAIAPTAHGDGAWVLDAAGRALRPGILSLDSRARATLTALCDGARGERIAQASGQLPMVSSAPVLLRWMKDSEPDTYARIRWLVFAKDMARLWLTGDICQDYTEVSSGLTDVETQEVSAELFEIYQIPELAGVVPRVRRSTEVAGGLTDAAASATGLPAGTPVAAGLHDIVAASVGAGAVHPGDVSVVAGSYCVNQCIADAPLRGEWMSRSFTSQGAWNLITASPSSSTNLDWFAHVLLPDLVQESQAKGGGSFGFLDGIGADPDALTISSPYYLPFLYGSPLPVDASAGLIGMRAWHDRSDAIRAVVEGIALNHRQHLERLPMSPIAVPKVMGGISRNVYWAQLFADLMGRDIEISATAEPGAQGAAMAAFVSVGFYDSLAAAGRAMVRPGRIVSPGANVELMQGRYQRYRSLLDHLTGWWGA